MEKKASFRNVFALGLVSFFTDISSEMVFSLIPTFLLGLPGSNIALLGLVEGTAESLSYGLRAVSGVFSDKFRKRKTLVLIGYAMSTLIKPLLSIARSVTDLFTIRVADRVGKAVRTSPRDALLSESVPAKQRGAAFGLHRSLDQTGAIIGPIAASTLMLFCGLTIRDVFWISLIPGAVALLIILLFVKERVRRPVSEFQLLAGMKKVLRGRFLLLLVLVGVFSLGAFNFSFVLLNAREAGVSDPLIPIVYAVVNVTHTVAAIPAGVLADKIGKDKVLVLGYGVFLFTAMLMLLSPLDTAAAFLTAAVFGVYFGIVETVQRALVPEYVESNLRGTAYGLYYLVVGSAFFVANTVVGTLWEQHGVTVAAAYSAAVTCVALMCLLALLKQRQSVKTDGFCRNGYTSSSHLLPGLGMSMGTLFLYSSYSSPNSRTSSCSSFRAMR